jgi:hypothetical protein
VNWIEYAAWGGFGGLAVELAEFYGVLRFHKTWPWNVEGEPVRGAFLASVAIRILLGGGLAWALGSSGEISGAIGAITTGVTAPLILEQLGRPTSQVGDRSQLSAGTSAERSVLPGRATAGDPSSPEDPSTQEIGGQ